MRPNLHDTIRKLLRRAAADDTDEAKSAGEHAQRLMARYKINVTIEPNRVRVDGVAGHFWRERLLHATARRYDCRVERYIAPKGKAQLVDVVGEGSAPDRVAETYKRAFLHVVVRARRAVDDMRIRFGVCVVEQEVDLTDFDSVLDMLRGPSKRGLAELKLWFRSFGVAAADEAWRTIDKAPPPPPPFTQKSAGKSDQEKESEEIGDQAKEVGIDKARLIIGMARGGGIAAIADFTWESNPSRLLSKKSTVPKRRKQHGVIDTTYAHALDL